MGKELADVLVRLVAGMDRDKAYCVTDGELEKTGDRKGRPRWIWLPKSMVEISEPDRDGNVTATMPTWLAEDKGLV